VSATPERRQRPRQETPGGLAAALGGFEVLICCGSGGVGKTTVSAALAVALARDGKRVLVLTVDPAKRLATALGLEDIGAEPVLVTPARLRRAGLDLRGRLVAAMLDQKSAWDRMIERHAPDRKTADRILKNRFYQGISDGFIGSQEYMAMETLYELHEAREYDIIVIDTPPSRNALDFLEAPERISDFVGAKLLSWLARPSRFGFRAMGFAASPFLKLADRLVGGEVLAELSDFVTDLRSLYGGVQERAEAVSRLLRSPRVGFVVVTTLEAAAFNEAEYFVSMLGLATMPLRAIVVNRTLPDALRHEGAARAAETLSDEPAVAVKLQKTLRLAVDADDAAQLGRNFALLSELATRDARQLSRLGRIHDVAVVRVPLITESVGDLEALVRVAQAF